MVDCVFRQNCYSCDCVLQKMIFKCFFGALVFFYTKKLKKIMPKKPMKPVFIAQYGFFSWNVMFIWLVWKR